MEENKKGWFVRNWKWVVPTGGCLGIIIFIIVIAGAMFSSITSLFENSTPYQEAMITLKNNPEVIELLGEPIEIEGGIKGGINIQNDGGNATFEIPVKGPKEKALYSVVAQKVNGEWSYLVLNIFVEDSHQEIDLLKSTKALE